MAVRATNSSPQELLNEINAAIRAGKVVTWQLDSDGDLTHSPEQWKNQAWFRPVVESGALVFKILGRKGHRMTKEVYGVYHGRLIEMLLVHFDVKFSAVSATALPVAGEVVSGQ
jgi:hypothetical protein